MYADYYHPPCLISFLGIMGETKRHIAYIQSHYPPQVASFELSVTPTSSKNVFLFFFTNSSEVGGAAAA